MAFPLPPRHMRVLCFCLLLAGCADPGQQKPSQPLLNIAELDVGKDIRDSGVSPRKILGDQWWAVFADPMLDRLVTASLADAPSLQLARARIDQAQGEAGVANAAPRPNLGFMSQLLRSQESSNYKTDSTNAGVWHTDGQVLLQAGYNLDLWGQNRALNEAALGNLRASQAEESVARLALVSSIVDTYFALNGVYSDLSIVERNLAQRQNILSLSEQRLSSGLGTRVDVVRAKGPIPVLEADKQRLLGLARSYQYRLAALAGKGPGWGEQWGRDPRFSNLSVDVSLPSELPAALIGGRPDVLAQRLKVEVQAKRIGAARAAFYPNINLVAFAGFQSFGFQTLLDKGSRTFGAGPAITLPLFDAGNLRSELQIENAAYAQAVATYNQTLVNAMAEIAGRVSQLQVLKLRQQKLEQGLAVAEQAYQLEVLRYRQNLTDFLHVLDTQTQVLDIQMTLSTLRTSVLQNHAGLLQALGGVWNETATTHTIIIGTSHE